MQCPRRQHENPPQAKFCLECGARVALTCTKCRSELPAGAKFWLECGEPVASQVTADARFTSPESYTPKHLAEKILTSKTALEGERKQVTVLFADLKGSTGRMESSLWMGLLPSAGASVEIDTPRMAMLHLASRAIRDRGLWRTDLAA